MWDGFRFGSTHPTPARFDVSTLDDNEKSRRMVSLPALLVFELCIELSVHGFQLQCSFIRLKPPILVEPVCFRVSDLCVTRIFPVR